MEHSRLQVQLRLSCCRVNGLVVCNTNDATCILACRVGISLASNTGRRGGMLFKSLAQHRLHQKPAATTCLQCICDQTAQSKLTCLQLASRACHQPLQKLPMLQRHSPNRLAGKQHPLTAKPGLAQQLLCTAHHILISSKNNSMLQPCLPSWCSRQSMQTQNVMVWH